MCAYMCAYYPAPRPRRRYGAFASKEQQLWPSVTRNPAGIPSLVLVGPDGGQLEYDGYPAIDQSGAKAVDAWATHAWPV